MIVTYRRRKRPHKTADRPETKAPRIIQHTRRGRAWKVLPPDAEADARVKAFMDRMIKPRTAE
jgi:hypothetical protein